MNTSNILKKFGPAILFACYVGTTAYTFYIGIFETIYSLGFYVALAIQALGILILGIAFIITKNLLKSLKVAAIVTIITQLIAITIYRIEEYKPTYIIRIPVDYVGPVNLFYTCNDLKDVHVNQNGVGYISSNGEVIWEVNHGNTSITNVLKSSHYQEIILDDSLKSEVFVYKVLCFTVNERDQHFPERINYKRQDCISPIAFEQLVKDGIVNEKIISKTVWKIGVNEDNRTIDKEKSRMCFTR